MTTTYTQVILRSYIAGLRDQLIEHNVKAEHAHEEDAMSGHAHFHGHEKCTAGKEMRECIWVFCTHKLYNVSPYHSYPNIIYL